MKGKIQKRTGLFVLVFLVIVVSSSYMASNVLSIAPGGGTHTFYVYGYVRDTSGNPISNALVRLQGGDPDVGIYESDYTDSNGRYDIVVVTSLYIYCSLTASKSGYATKTYSVYSKGTIQKDFSLSPATHYFRVYGYVRDEEFSTPIGGATVKLINPSGSVVRTYTTSSSGYYSITYYTGLYATFTVKASKSGYGIDIGSAYSSGSRYVNLYLKDYWDEVDPDGQYVSKDYQGNTVMIYSAYTSGNMDAYHAASWGYCRASMRLTEYWTAPSTGDIIVRNDYIMNFNTDGTTVPYCKVSFVTTFYDGYGQTVAELIIMNSQGPNINPPVNVNDYDYLMCGVVPYIEVTAGLSYKIETYLVIEIYQGDYFSLSTNTGAPAEFYSMFDISYV